MKAFLVGLWSAFLDRVFKNWKPTLVGLLVATGIVVVDQFTTYLQALPDGWAKYAALVAVAIGGWLKKKATTYPQPAQPAP